MLRNKYRMSNQAQESVEELSKEKWTDILKSKNGIVTGIATVVAVAVLIGVGSYNAPMNRLNRQLDLG